MERFSAADEEEVQLELTSTSNDIFELSNNFRLDDDMLWQNYTCNLFSAGLDNTGYEVSKYPTITMLFFLLPFYERLFALLITLKITLVQNETSITVQV